MTRIVLCALMLAGCSSNPIEQGAMVTPAIAPTNSVSKVPDSLMPQLATVSVMSAQLKLTRTNHPAPPVTNLTVTVTPPCVFDLQETMNFQGWIDDGAQTNSVTLPNAFPNDNFRAMVLERAPLQWTPVDTNATGCNIYYGTTSGVYPNKVTVMGATSDVIRNLPSGTTYYFVATSVDAQGDESGFSNEVVYTTPSSAPPVLSIAAN